MIVEYIRYDVGGRGVDFEAAYREARASLDASPHCMAYELARCGEDPWRYILRIKWDSPEGHMQGFHTSPEFKTFLAAVRPYLGDIEEMRHYEVTAVTAQKEA